MILRFLGIAGILLLMTGVYLAWMMLIDFSDPEEALHDIHEFVSEDLSVQRDGAQIGTTTLLMERVISYIRNGIREKGD